jgi:hypothetical protein
MNQKIIANQLSNRMYANKIELMNIEIVHVNGEGVACVTVYFGMQSMIIPTIKIAGIEKFKK